MVITSPFCSASKNFHQNDDKFAIKHSMQPMQCCMEGSIIIHHGIQNFFGYVKNKPLGNGQIISIEVMVFVMTAEVKTDVAPSINCSYRPQNCSSESEIQQMALQF